MRAGSLCTGIGGLDLAIEAHFGAELVWYSELEPAPCKVLEREWPGVPNLGDLTVLDWAEVPTVDVLTAGYPCQPFSHAGKRKGKNDVRHLWPFIAEAVRVLRPRWVCLENVAGHLTLGFGDVLRDLAEAGFDAEWCLLRASDVGACHQRARLFIVAADSDRESTGRDGGAAPRPQEPDGGRGAAHLGHGPSDGAVPATDARGERHGRGQDTRGVGPVDSGDAGAPRERQRPWEVVGDRGGQAAADTNGIDGRGRGEIGRLPSPPGAGDQAVAWGQYAPAIRRWELTLGRPAPAPTDDAGRLAPAFVEWMMGYPQGWVDGLTRTQALKALGNAVVPQQGLAALRELAPVEALEVAS